MMRGKLHSESTIRNGTANFINVELILSNEILQFMLRIDTTPLFHNKQINNETKHSRATPLGVIFFRP